MRAIQPTATGVVRRNGVDIAWESFGEGEVPIVLLPTWSIIPSRFWKLQVPYLARHHRVVTFDGRGTGRSSRPVGAEAYTHLQFTADTLAVLDELAIDRAVLVSFSRGSLWGTQVAADHPERVAGLVAIGPAVPLAAPLANRGRNLFEESLDAHDGWAKYNAEYWKEDFEDFLQFFFSNIFSEPHSTKQIEDCVAWGLEGDPVVLADTHRGLVDDGRQTFPALCKQVSCPVLVIHGDEDAIRSHASGAALAEATGGRLVTVVGGGHAPHVRDPVFVNRLIDEFTQHVTGRSHAGSSRFVRSPRRAKRALYLSSPIGLGHARRDAAIAAELHRLHPDLHIDWLAQDPVTHVLAAAGECVHPASRWLVNESAHFEDEAHEHDLHAFQAIRRMDEILVNNFMVFHDVVADQDYDLVVADEAWDVDYFLHENPELKRFAFAWMTDFVGWLPMPGGGDAEAALTSDYNAEMIEQRARYRRLRDRSIFVGDADDIVPDAFGPDLPMIRQWTEENFDFAGYITGFDPAELADGEALRHELGYHPDERVCIVTVGGSGVGLSLLRRVIDAIPLTQRLVDDLRFVVVAGPRIDPRELPQLPGVTYHRYVPDLHRHLAACDVAVVQGGLTTCMELTANRRPFVFIPLQNHFEQNFHVAHRLKRHGAGMRLNYTDAIQPEVLAAAIASQVDAQVQYLPVDPGGAARAAQRIAELL
jgi:pimeloyl-ACP methyl ester carboxylesterase/predicted glycosyltransferase